MIDPFSPETTYAVGLAGYLITIVVFAAWVRRFPTGVRKLGYAMIGMLCVAAVSTAATWAGVGTVPVGVGEVDVPTLVDDTIAYSLVFAVTAVIAGASRRMVLFAGGFIAVMRLSFEISAITEGIVSLVTALIMVGGYFVHLYLFLGPIERVASRGSEERWLLYWKCRNLILFLLGMLILVGVIALIPAAYDPFVLAVISQYMDLFIKVGYAAFIFATVGSIEGSGRLDLRIGGRSPTENAS